MEDKEGGSMSGETKEKLMGELVKIFPKHEVDIHYVFSQVLDVVEPNFGVFSVWFKDIHGLLDLADLFFYLYRHVPESRNIIVEIHGTHAMIFMLGGEKA
jgi:hypothetical protein